MAGSARDIKLGACWVYFGSLTGAIGEVVDLGYTKGGVTVTIETGSYEILVDQEGQSPVGETILGRRVMVMCPLAETNYERLSKIIPDSSYASNTLKIKSGIGDDLMDYTDLLHLVSRDDPEDWVKIYKAAPVVNLTATFLPNAERIWPVQFKGYIPESGHSEAGNLIGLHLIS